MDLRLTGEEFQLEHFEDAADKCSPAEVTDRDNYTECKVVKGTCGC